MERISYKVFMEKVRDQISEYSKEQLQSIILEWAARKSPANRGHFLNKLNLKEMPEPPEEPEVLLHDIEVFIKEVENGDFVDGYGWDYEMHDERIFGDESWSTEMDDLLIRVRNVIRSNDTKVSEEAYRKLFDVLDLGDQEGLLPGDLDSSSMLDEDVFEHMALFLGSIYMNTEPEERPTILYTSMNTYRYLSSPNIKLADIKNAFDSTLPNFNEFLSSWIPYLKEKQPFYYNKELIREAVFLNGGIAALAKFATENPIKYPEAFLDWINALKLENDMETVLEAANKGLESIPQSDVVRAKVAEELTKIGSVQDNIQLQIKGLRESFHSDPSLHYLLDLYLTAMEIGNLEKIKAEAETRMIELYEKQGNKTNMEDSNRSSQINRGSYMHGLLLGGNHEQAFTMCKGNGSLGWSSSEHPKPIMLGFLMYILSSKGNYSTTIHEQWEHSIQNAAHLNGETYGQKHKKIMNHMINKITFTAEQKETYLKWCEKEASKRIDAIVSNKYRGSYHKAAMVLVAMGETLANQQNKQDGLLFIERFEKKYSRHSAFRRETRDILQASELK